MTLRFKTANHLRTLLLGFAIASLGAAAGAQESRASLPMTLTLEPSKRSYELGEPVYVTTRLRNTGGKAQRLQTMLNPSAGFLTVRVGRPGTDRPMQFIPLAVGDYELPETELAAGGEMNATFPIFFGGNGWTFPASGTYELTAVLEGPRTATLRSESTTITVTPGKGAGRYLFGLSRDDQFETGKFLVWQQGDHLRRAHATLDEIIRGFPDSEVANHARLAVGVSLSRPFSDYSIGRVRPPRPDRALEMLEMVRPEGLPDLLKLHRQLAIARSYVALGRNDAAGEALSEAQAFAADPRRAVGETLAAEMSFDPLLSKMAGERQ